MAAQTPGMDSLPLTTSGCFAQILSVCPSFQSLPFFPHPLHSGVEVEALRCSHLLGDDASTGSHFQLTLVGKSKLLCLCKCAAEQRANHGEFL